MRCDDCLFWRILPGYARVAECRRHAPRPDARPAEDAPGWPLTTPASWCGEFQARPALDSLDAPALLAELTRRGFALTAGGGKVFVSPASRLTAAERAALVAGKPDLLPLLPAAEETLPVA